jgi:transcriptional accessory protein Tex/SPT6
MEKEEGDLKDFVTTFQLIFAAIGGYIGWFLGGLDGLLYALVTFVVDFGAFVDIGVKQDGLVHLSEMSDKYIKNPMEVVQVGDTVNVTIISIDKERQRIGLSMKKSRSKND